MACPGALAPRGPRAECTSSRASRAECIGAERPPQRGAALGGGGGGYKVAAPWKPERCITGSRRGGGQWKFGGGSAGGGAGASRSPGGTPGGALGFDAPADSSGGAGFFQSVGKPKPLFARNSGSSEGLLGVGASWQKVQRPHAGHPPRRGVVASSAAVDALFFPGLDWGWPDALTGESPLLLPPSFSSARAVWSIFANKSSADTSKPRLPACSAHSFTSLASSRMAAASS